VFLLVASQHSISGDEATVGVTAMHILSKGERPVFAYGADYNGGSAMTAYLAALVFAVVGPSEVALKCLPVAFGLLAVYGVYLLVRSGREGWVALWAAFLYGTSVSLLKWNFDARGGYAECQALLPFVFWLLATKALRSEGGVAGAALVGLLSGFGVYLLQMFVPVGLTCALYLAFSRGPRGRRLAAFVAGALAGLLPLALHGTPAGSVGLDPRPLLARLGGLPAGLWTTLIRYLPGLFSYDNFEGYPPFRLLPNGLETLFLATGLGLLVFRGRGRGQQDGPPLVGILVLYTLLYLLLFSLHPLAGESPRYLLFLVPSLSILTALGLATALETGAPPPLHLGAVLLVGLVLAERAVQVAALAGDDRIYGPDGTSSPQAAEALIAFLRQRGVPRLVTEDWDLGWRVVFKTGEDVSVSHNLNNLHQPIPFVVAVPQESDDDRRVAALLEKRSEPVERVTLYGKSVYAVGASSSPGAPHAAEAPPS
jgi:hypothetical protein